MNISDLFDSLEEIKDSSSRLDKESIISEILDSESHSAFKFICSFMFDPYRRLNVRVSSSMLDDADLSDTTSLDPSSTWDHFTVLLRDLETKTVSGKLAKTRIKDFLSICDYDQRVWYSMILNKNWKIGVGRPTIEKFLGKDFAPRFDVQLCGKYVAGTDFTHDQMIQPKLDGVRGVVGCFPRFGRTVALTRNGKELYNSSLILKSLDELEHIYGEPYVFDGEFYAGNWETTIGIVRRSTRSHHLENTLKFHIFDAIPLESWLKASCIKSLSDRDELLKSNLELLDSDVLVHVPSRYAKLSNDIDKITEDYIKDGWEGSIIKDPASFYEYERSRSWLKHKAVLDVDAEVVGVKLGLHIESTNEIINDDDPRYYDLQGNPVVRSLIIDPGNGVHTSVGSGIDVVHKYEFYEMHIEGGLLGNTVEVHYQEYTPDGKLRFPRYIRTRSDK